MGCSLHSGCNAPHPLLIQINIALASHFLRLRSLGPVTWSLSSLGSEFASLPWDLLRPNIHELQEDREQNHSSSLTQRWATFGCPNIFSLK